MSNLHEKKMIAPIIIAAIGIVYFAGFIGVCLLIPIPVVIKIIFGVVPLALIGVTIFVLVERIQEIRSGEEDDLSKY